MITRAKNYSTSIFWQLVNTLFSFRGGLGETSLSQTSSKNPKIHNFFKPHCLCCSLLKKRPIPDTFTFSFDWFLIIPIPDTCFAGIAKKSNMPSLRDTGSTNLPTHAELLTQWSYPLYRLQRQTTPKNGWGRRNEIINLSTFLWCQREPPPQRIKGCKERLPISQKYLSNDKIIWILFGDT